MLFGILDSPWIPCPDSEFSADGKLQRVQSISLYPVGDRYCQADNEPDCKYDTKECTEQ